MDKHPFPRIDKDEKLARLLLPYCRLKKGEVWEDETSGHKVGCLDVNDTKAMEKFTAGEKASLAVHDPPYNFVAFDMKNVEEFTDWAGKWIQFSYDHSEDDASLYVWLGADQAKHYTPFPEFMLMMRNFPYESRSFITMRNQRGYGTQKNWMSIRQELLYYIKGNPVFNCENVYTDIPKVLRGYYKKVNGEVKENIERSKSENIRAGNVWVDIQQVFHLMEENVHGCYAQKPIKSIERIIAVSSKEGDVVFDFFSHAGTTLVASEILKRKCLTIDINPVYCEISIRRLENLRRTGKTGWQSSNPFAEEIMNDTKLKNYLKKQYNYQY